MRGPSNREKHPRGRHEYVGRGRVVAAGSPEAERVPRVHYLEVALLDREHRVDRAVTRLPSRRVDEAAGEQQVGVRDPAAERPSAGHDDPAVHGACLAPRRPHAGRDAPPTAEQLLARLGRQIGGEQAAGDRDRHTPAGRGVTSGHLLRALERDARRELRPVDLDGCAASQQAGVTERCNELVREPPSAFGLHGQLTRQAGYPPRYLLDLAPIGGGRQHLAHRIDHATTEPVQLLYRYTR